MNIEFDKVKWLQDDDGFWLLLRLENPKQGRMFTEEKKEGTYIAKLDKKRNIRTLNANAYFWSLCDKLAEKTGISKTEIYKDLIKEIGGNSVIIPIKDEAKETWIKNWESRGLGWICEDLGRSKIKGYSNIMTYYGSSTYTDKQMSRLIDLIIQECEIQDIDTKTPEQLAILREY